MFGLPLWEVQVTVLLYLKSIQRPEYYVIVITIYYYLLQKRIKKWFVLTALLYNNECERHV